MVISCWSAKGGSGTTVVAAAIASVLAGAPGAAPPLLVDAAGELPLVLGIPEPEGHGVTDWLQAPAEAPADALARLEVPAGAVALLPRGQGPLAGAERASVLSALLAASARSVVIDCGLLAGPGLAPDELEVRRRLAAASEHSLLVSRPCYLSLRRAVAAPVHPTGVVLVTEPGRALGPGDVASVLGVPVVATVPWDQSVARAVDAGLLGCRLPRVLARAVAGAA